MADMPPPTARRYLYMEWNHTCVLLPAILSRTVVLVVGAVGKKTKSETGQWGIMSITAPTDVSHADTDGVYINPITSIRGNPRPFEACSIQPCSRENIM